MLRFHHKTPRTSRIALFTLALAFTGCWWNGLAGCWWQCFCCCSDDTKSAAATTELTSTKGAAEANIMVSTDIDLPITAQIDGHTFITCLRPCVGLRSIDNAGQPLPLQRLNETVRLEWYADNCTNKRLSELVKAAMRCLENHKNAQKSAQQTDSKAAAKKPDLVIFDVDNTMLSSFGIELKLAQEAQANKTLSIEDRTKICLECASDILPIHALYNYARELGYHIAIISARPASGRDITLKQLTQNGYNLTKTDLYLNDNAELAAYKFKEKIRAQLAQQYTIVANVDDSYLNLQGEHLGIYNIWVPNIIEVQLGSEKFFRTLLIASC